MRDETKTAEDCRYWKTGTSSPDIWMEKIITLLKDFGGEVTSSGYVNDNGKSAYMIKFYLNEELFKIIWPVLESSTGNEMAARRQSVTMLYHDIKAKCVSADILGVRASFFSYLALDDGRTMLQLSNSQLMEKAPLLLTKDDEVIN